MGGHGQSIGDFDWKGLADGVLTDIKEKVDGLTQYISSSAEATSAAEYWYYGGYITLNIIEIVIPFGAIVKALDIGGDFGKLASFIRKISKGFEDITTAVFKPVATVLEKAFVFIKWITKLFKKGKDKFLEFFRKFWDGVKEEMANAKKAYQKLTLGFSDELMEALEKIGVEYRSGNLKLAPGALSGPGYDISKGGLYYKGRLIVAKDNEALVSINSEFAKVRQKLEELKGDEEALRKYLGSLLRLTDESQRLLISKIDEWANIHTDFRPTVGCIFEKIDNNGKILRITNGSHKGLERYKFIPGLHPLVSNWVDEIYAGFKKGKNLWVKGNLGKCGEVLNLSEILFHYDPSGKFTLKEAREALEGTISIAVNIKGKNSPSWAKISKGDTRIACDNCERMLPYFNVTEIYKLH